MIDRALSGSVVVGSDGSLASLAAERWASAHVASPEDVVVVDRRSDDVDVVVEALLDEAHAGGAVAVVVGHEPRERFGAGLVGKTTTQLLQAARCPVIIVPASWDPSVTSGRPVAVGVGVARGTRAAVAWIRGQLGLARDGLLLVHALGPRSLFRPDGWLDAVAYHLDASIVPSWIEQDLDDLAERIVDESGIDLEVDVLVGLGPTGSRLLEAAGTASLLVVGRGEPTFVREHVMAPYLRRAITHAPCPIVVVPTPLP